MNADIASAFWPFDRLIRSSSLNDFWNLTLIDPEFTSVPYVRIGLIEWNQLTYF